MAKRKIKKYKRKLLKVQIFIRHLCVLYGKTGENVPVLFWNKHR